MKGFLRKHGYDLLTAMVILGACLLVDCMARDLISEFEKITASLERSKE
jgi:hypothetical protein